MDGLWWPVLAVAVGWQLRQCVRRSQAVSRLIDDDVVAFDCEHRRAVAVMLSEPLLLFMVSPLPSTRSVAASSEIDS